MSIDLCLVQPPRKCWLSGGILLGGLLAMVCSPAEAGGIVPTCLAGSLAALLGPENPPSANGLADAPNGEQVAETETEAETDRDQPPRATSDEPLPEAGQSDGQPGDPGSPAPPAHDSPPSPATSPVKPQAEGQVEDEKSTDTEPPDPEKMTDSEEDAELLERIKVGDGSPLDQAF
ncbi:MAG: hypothetical protein ACKOGA_13680, partial [Planctomycetaceae bacterium]